MADQLKVLAGLGLLQDYKPDGVTWHCDAQHDVLYAQGRPPDEMDAHVVVKLNELGWCWDDEVNSWRRFT